MEILRIENISKRFGATQALEDVSLSFHAGKVHSLVGRNGAGKSTLVNIIAGTVAQNSGVITYQGNEISHMSVADRQAAGIRIVTQHAAVIPELTVGENVFLGLWPKKRNRLVNWSKLYENAAEELKTYGLDSDVTLKAKNLSPVDQRKVNIVRAIYGGAKLVILDEPTTSLSSQERENLFSFIRKLSERGTSFIFITHYLDEVLRLSDEITVLRDGIAFTGYTRKSLTATQLEDLVAGENVRQVERTKKSYDDTENVLVCKSVSDEVLQDVNFTVRKGEIVGIVGFPGSGARRMCRMLSGMYKNHEGEIYIAGEPFIGQSPAHALESGVGYVTNDRHKEGIVQEMSIKHNISLMILKKLRKRKFFIDFTKENEVADTYYDVLKIKANSLEQQVNALSGGNQQKVVVAKILSSKPRLLILDEPTIGIDIKSREEILSIVNEISNQGVSVLYLTNDYNELTRISDRFLFFSEGKITNDMINEGLQAEDLIKIRDK